MTDNRTLLERFTALPPARQATLLAIGELLEVSEAARPAAESAPSARRQPLKPCGTTAAAERHRRAGERPCEACRLAVNAKRRAQRQARHRPRRELLPCGTEAAWQRHKRAAESPCNECRDAHRAYNREAKKRHRVRSKESNS